MWSAVMTNKHPELYHEEGTDFLFDTSASPDDMFV